MDNFKDSLVQEFKEINLLAKLIPQKTWDLIWVLTAGEVDIKLNKNKKNETRERLETGIKLVKKITAQRVGKNKLSQVDLKSSGPKIYFSGYNEHNLLMKKNLKNKLFEAEYNFPGENILVGPQENILHTDHQFQKFPVKLTLINKKIVIVTSAYHIPRCRRYLMKYPKKFSLSQFIFYPSRPFDLKEKQVDSEIKKIIAYTESGILPKLNYGKP